MRHVGQELRLGPVRDLRSDTGIRVALDRFSEIVHHLAEEGDSSVGEIFGLKKQEETHLILVLSESISPLASMVMNSV